ncbi:RNA polymerase sigma factor RpoD [Elysia marginata]|uniref:RNA polymerase sigma factor RpoD n=1 Tax=Elysia marginata TaxID=1093978 RepID=A0AAV4G933_9GAST|nr:RNA polymerase sigma factor RpoD [Elysia marginata]
MRKLLISLLVATILGLAFAEPEVEKRGLKDYLKKVWKKTSGVAKIAYDRSLFKKAVGLTATAAKGTGKGVATVATGAAKGVAKVATGAAKGVATVAKGTAKGVATVATGAAKGVAKVATGAAKGLAKVGQGAVNVVKGVVGLD